MKAMLSNRTVLWTLFLFNTTAAIAAPLIAENSQGYMTSAGMGVVALGMGVALYKGRPQHG
ncbi:hypothetical protein [Streptomyces sp. 4F14]|uniref:hypothetical protein n=1 Tax=Streptomyces sp. 4F14 TaxID=3394380 RepID=UPI003A88AD27